MAFNKSSLSDYGRLGVSSRETLLADFSRPLNDSWKAERCSMKQLIGEPGFNGGCVCLSKPDENKLVELTCSDFPFLLPDRSRFTLRMTVAVNSVDSMISDHDSANYREEGCATIFLRLFDGALFTQPLYAVNHTFRGAGIQDIEFSFLCCNLGYKDQLAESYRGFGSMQLFMVGKTDIELKIGNIRLCEYSSSYVSAPAPDNGRMLCHCDANELGSAVITEWFGASFDSDIKTSGCSSIRLEGNSSSSDFRVYLGNLCLPVCYERDVLCVSMMIDDLSLVKSVFFELNRIQDFHEYENCYTPQELGITEPRSWFNVRIPLRTMRKNLHKEIFGDTDDMTADALRIAVNALSESENYVIHFDEFYITDESNLSV